jgi:hypothetical protein
MSPADRYSLLRECAIIREGAAAAAAREWSEHEVQALWFAGAFGKNFTTTDGRAVSVVQFGVWNREAGPDFAEAAVSFDGGAAQRASIELDMDVADWEHHGHATNAAYDDVVLHVFASSGPREFFTRTSQHRAVPQVQLDLRAIEEPPNPQPDAKPGRCVAPLRALPLEKVRDVLMGSAQFRMRKKSAALARLAELHGPDESLYQALATTLGYKANKLPFTLLAQRLPLRLLRAAKDSATALLFGVAGFLDQRELAPFDSPTRAFLRGLWEQWWPRRAEFERLALPREVWKMSGQRPMNHPQRRLAALAQIVRHFPHIRALRDACVPDATAEFFDGLRDEYWEHMFTQLPAPLNASALRNIFQEKRESKNTSKNSFTEIHRCSCVSSMCISRTARIRSFCRRGGGVEKFFSAPRLVLASVPRKNRILDTRKSTNLKHRVSTEVCRCHRCPHALNLTDFQPCHHRARRIRKPWRRF